VEQGIFIESLGTISIREAATLVIQEARDVVQEELGLERVNWDQTPVTPVSQKSCTQESEPQTPPTAVDIEVALAALEATCNTPHRTPSKGEIERLGLSPDLFEESMEDVEEKNDKVAVIEVVDAIVPYFISSVQQTSVLALSIAVSDDSELQLVTLACVIANETVVFCLDPKGTQSLILRVVENSFSTFVLCCFQTLKTFK